MKKSTLFFILLSAFLIASCEGDKEVDNPFLFKEYISYNTHGRHSAVEPVVIELVKPLKQFKANQKIENKYLTFSPEIEGTLKIESGHKLVFTPKKRWKPSTEYFATLHLGMLYDSVPKKLKNYTFSFKIIQPNFKINIDFLQSYSSDWQYLKGTLEASDVIPFKKLNYLLKATQDGKPLTIKWDSIEWSNKTFSFIIDSIQRKLKDDSIHISWNGEAINAETSGETYYPIIGKEHFKVVKVKTENNPTTALAINFSDPLDPNQDFSGLVRIGQLQNLKFEVKGNVLFVYPSKRVSEKIPLVVFPGIKSKDGRHLDEIFRTEIAFKEIKPQVKLISKGVILPNAQSTPLYFKAVNLSAVDVSVIKIYDDNMLQFLQQGGLGNTSSSRIRRVGRLIKKKTIHLDSRGAEKGEWKAYGIQLSKLFKADPGALYRIEISFKKAYSTYDCGQSMEVHHANDTIGRIEPDIKENSNREEEYWNNKVYSRRNRIYDWEHQDNPCYAVYYQSRHFVSTNVLGSDLGIIVKRGLDNSMVFYTTNLVTAKPIANAKIKLYNYQQQLLTTIQTGEGGKATFQGNGKVVFAVAHYKDNYAYIKLEEGDALSMSKYDVGGEKLQEGLKGFIYTERGVYRPGDTIHLTFVLDDKENLLPKNVPVKLEVKNARGKLVQRTVLPRQNIQQKYTIHPRKENRFYYFPIPTKKSTPTGSWSAEVSIGGAHFYKMIRVATVKPNRLNIKLNFKNKILSDDQPIQGTLSSSWLQGAPARNLKAEIEMTLTPKTASFKNYSDYIFEDPIRDFSRTKISVFKNQLSADGKASFSKSVELNQNAPGMLKATFLTKVFEGGGDFSIDVFSKPFSPFSELVGIRTPKEHRYGSFYTDEDNRFDVVTLTPDGKVVPHRKLHVQVFKIEWQWWWNRREDNLSQYTNARIHRPYKDFYIETDAKGKGHFIVNVPENRRGRYLIRVIDEKSGHATGLTTYFFRNWGVAWGNNSTADNAAMLVFSANKKEFTVGDTATITFPSSLGDRALVSIENGTKVLQSEWVKTKEGKTKYKFVVSKEMAPNIYVNISLLQPLDQVKNDLPIRLFGVIPLKVKDPKTWLYPEIDMPKTLHPNQDFKVTVSEKNDRPMTYTIAVVDEGLLALTRFKTPAIHSAFYTHQALGVNTFDVYKYVIGAFSGSVHNIYEIGGDKALKQGKKHQANRFTPVVKYLGPFYLKAGEKETHTIHIPNYIGAVRTMIVAGNKKESAYGNAQKITPVKKPLMVLASLPRKLSPGEEVTLPVTVFTMGDKVKTARIHVSTTKGLKAIGSTTKTLHFNGPDQKIVNFKYKVLPSQKPQEIHVRAQGNGHKASYDVEVGVFNPNPYTHKVTDYTLEKKGTKSIVYNPYGIKNTRSVSLELSTLPPMDFTKRLKYLIHYPHGCVEQTTSSGFPQLYLADIFDLSVKEKQATEENVKATITRLGYAQLPNGAFPFWPGGNHPSEWATSYAGHFLLEAKAKGYAMPISFFRNWVQYQESAARKWSFYSTAYNSSLQQAYRLYTLALAGHPEMAVMNRLRSSINKMTNAAKWRLAAAYALAGKEDVARKITSKATIHFQSHPFDRYTYGSPFRNEAMALETMVLLGNKQQKNLAKTIAKKLSSDRWFSTQETSFALLAIAKMVEKNGGKGIDVTLQQGGKKTVIKTTHAMAKRTLISSGKSQKINVINHDDNIVFLSLYQEGKLKLGKENVQQHNLTVTTRFLNGNNKPISVDKLHQGTKVTAKITVKNTSNDYINDLALTQVFPSGWEIVNTTFTELKGTTTGEAKFKDIRDDRVYFYFDLRPGKSKTFTVQLNTSYLGHYYLPGTHVNGMYDDSYYADNKGQWVTIIP